ncbi:hypothetical protein SANTM175S_01423 [Streptomyces antimycoticus]
MPSFRRATFRGLTPSSRFARSTAYATAQEEFAGLVADARVFVDGGHQLGERPLRPLLLSSGGHGLEGHGHAPNVVVGMRLACSMWAAYARSTNHHPAGVCRAGRHGRGSRTGSVLPSECWRVTPTP